jgi:hypothetical protein
VIGFARTSVVCGKAEKSSAIISIVNAKMFLRAKGTARFISVVSFTPTVFTAFHRLSGFKLQCYSHPATRDVAFNV